MIFSSLNIFDIVIIVVIILSGVAASWRGLIKELSTLLVWFISVLISNKLYLFILPYTDYLIDNNTPLNKAISWLIPFLMSIIILSIFNKFLINSFLKIHNNIINHIFGLIFGVLRGLLVICLIYLSTVFIMQNENLFPSQVHRSYSLPIVRSLSIYILTFIPDELSKDIKPKILFNTIVPTING